MSTADIDEKNTEAVEEQVRWCADAIELGCRDDFGFSEPSNRLVSTVDASLD
jgi:hypothetical protein